MESTVIHDYDDVFVYIGERGLYQIFMFILLGLPAYFAGFNGITVNFYAYPQEHWCYVERLQHYPHEWQKYVAVPYVDGSDDQYDSCLIYDLDYDNLTDEDIRQWNRSLQVSDDTATLDCDAWVYDQSEVVSTIYSEVNYVCFICIL